jgi:transposase
MSTSEVSVSAYLGLDIGKAKIHVALVQPKGQPKRKVISNNSAGHQELLVWLSRQSVSPLHACLEATSTYGHEVAKCLHQAGYGVSIVNPKTVHAYGESRLVRTKTDGVDSVMIAEYCRDIQPHLWTPPAPEIEQLQEWVRRQEALEEMIVQERNRLETVTAADLRCAIEAHIAFMQQQQGKLSQQIQQHMEAHPALGQQQQLLCSIPGIGLASAARILGEVGDWRVFSSARQLAAYAGLSPQEKTSGTSVHGKARMCKLGNARLRKVLFLPALNLLRWHPGVQQWREQLLKRGKNKRQVVGAVMHKLMRWVFGILRSAQPFDEKLAMARQPQA